MNGEVVRLFKKTKRHFQKCGFDILVYFSIFPFFSYYYYYFFFLGGGVGERELSRRKKEEGEGEAKICWNGIIWCLLFPVSEKKILLDLQHTHNNKGLAMGSSSSSSSR